MFPPCRKRVLDLVRPFLGLGLLGRLLFFYYLRQFRELATREIILNARHQKCRSEATIGKLFSEFSARVKHIPGRFVLSRATAARIFIAKPVKGTNSTRA